MNNAISINLESALVAYLTPICTFAASVTGNSDPRHADEEQYGILGAYAAVPAVIVNVGPGEQEIETTPVLRFNVVVTVRSSTLRSLVATHNTNSTTVADAMWDESTVMTELNESETIIVSSIHAAGETFTREGRKLETTFNFSIVASSKDNT